MAITFEPIVLEEFFGVTLDETLIPETGRRQYWIGYSGPTLKYALIVDVERDTVMISGDRDIPWSGESMYEIGVPCTSIHAHPSGYDPGGIALAFFYGDTSNRRNRMLTIMKRQDLDLVVWPSWPYPVGHPNAYQDD
jgi:hypothetical protein